MTISATTAVSPADFGDPEATNLGEYRGAGDITHAAGETLGSVRALAWVFPDAFAKVQFFFNETPAVATPDSTVEDVVADWSARRDAYQRAAGIAPLSGAALNLSDPRPIVGP